jgi:hypothetical protein
VSSPPRRLPAFLAPAARRALRDRAATATGWEAGRQGSGYHKLPLRDAGRADPVLEMLLVQARVALGVEIIDWDAYLLRYPEGSSVPPHRDSAEGGRHLRLNALIAAGERGTGELRLEGKVFELAPGDAVVFRSDQITHQVSPVVGERLVLSVGCVY